MGSFGVELRKKDFKNVVNKDEFNLGLDLRSLREIGD